MGVTVEVVPKKWAGLQVVSFLGTLLFCLYIATISHLDILPWFDRYNEKRILELLLLLVVTSLFLAVPSCRREWLSMLGHLPGTSKVILFCIVFAGLFSAAGAYFPRFALLEVNLFVLLFAASICVACSRMQLGKVFENMVAITLFLMGWLYLAGFLGYYLTALSWEISLSRPDFWGNFSNIRFFNQLQSWTLSLMVIPLLLFPKRSFLITILFSAVAIGWWLLLFASNCRGTLVGILFAFPITLLLFRQQARRWIQWQIVAIGGGLATYLLFFTLIPHLMAIEIPTILDRELTQNNARIKLWSMAGKMVQDQPWLGAGPMHFAAQSGDIASHPHNALLQIAAEWGAPVALLVLILFGWGVLSWLKNANPHHLEEDKSLQAALFASLLTAAVHSLFSGIIVMPMSQVMMMIVTGWMIGISAQSRDVEKNHSRLKHLALLLITPMVFFSTLWSLFPEVCDVEKIQSEFVQSHPELKNLRPRFWQHGDLE